MITYHDLGPSKRLNEIVVPGSHDAGITQGKGNTKTQELDIAGQANAGVRVFDLRVTGAVVKSGAASDVVALKTYHGPGIKTKPTAIDLRTGQQGKVTVKHLAAGDYGMTLTKILTDAVNFVTENATEFLILKFDKCDNYEAIARACVEILGARAYRAGGNLNTKTLREVAGTVIVLFPSKGVDAVHHLYGIPQGILGFKNLSGGKSAYNPDYHGLQYFGKGGTSVAKPFGKIKQNIKKQTKLMQEGVDGNPNVMGMMYWTTTGLNESIRDRDTGMWTAPNVQKLRDMWSRGLEHAITSRVSKFTRINGFAGGQTIKAFMPNIVMIDFADAEKCKQIFELNTIPVTFIVDALGNYTHT